MNVGIKGVEVTCLRIPSNVLKVKKDITRCRGVESVELNLLNEKVYVRTFASVMDFLAALYRSMDQHNKRRRMMSNKIEVMLIDKRIEELRHKMWVLECTDDYLFSNLNGNLSDWEEMNDELSELYAQKRRIENAQQHNTQHNQAA